ncbi:MAG: RHS repeat-associated core domain-containing protein, partial [Bacteroidota bacterium]|nr:RHS repeat-associated core domain-containing protein [Bacteroidota bacterium]
YGLEDYNFAFRNYDAQIGRWLQPDPLMQHPSPYLAMSNNPVSFTDPSGLWDGSNPKFVGEVRNGFMWNGQMWEIFETTVISKNHFMLGSLETTSGNEAYLPDNGSGTEVSGVNGKLRRVGDAYNRGHYIENERNWAKGMNAGISKEQKAQILKNEIIESLRKSTPEYYGGSGSLELISGIGSIGSLIKAAKTSTKLLNQFNSAESLIQGAGNLTKVKAGMQGFVKGDGASIFKAITNGGTLQSNGQYLMQNGTQIGSHLSKTTGAYTIHITPTVGKMTKIRITP